MSRYFASATHLSYFLIILKHCFKKSENIKDEKKSISDLRVAKREYKVKLSEKLHQGHFRANIGGKQFNLF